MEINDGMHVELWKHIPGFKFVEIKKSIVSLKYCGGSIRNVIDQIRKEPISKKNIFLVVIFSKKHNWILDYEWKYEEYEIIHISRIDVALCGQERKNKVKKTSRFFGVFYLKSVLSNRNWIAFHYKDADEKHDRSKNPECSKIVQRIGKYSSEHEAAVAHDAFVLWYGLSNRLNYKQFKRPVSLDELNLILQPKEETCGKLTRPDCYKCKWHLEIPEKPIIRCRNCFAEIHPYRVALEHGWWNFPLIDPLWLESCDSFLPVIGASSVIIDNGESMEVIVKENKNDILTKKEKISGESLRKEEQGAAQKEFKGD